MQKRVYFSTGLTLLLGIALTGCGPFGGARVVKQLQSYSQNLQSYQSTAQITFNEAGGSQQYDVETWYAAPDRYRIALGNDSKEISQIILHNDKGAYLITPSAKRVMRFQGDWAERQGQLYLYQVLLNDIVNSDPLRYRQDKTTMTFFLKPVVASPFAATEEVRLNRQTYDPLSLTFLDQQQKPVLSVRYTSFKKGVTFRQNAFSPDQTTTLKALELPVSASQQGFGVIEPAWIPARDTLQDEVDKNGVVLIRYSGSSPFTLIENRPQSGAVDLGRGQLMSLNGLPAVWVGSGFAHQLYWTNQNVEYTMTSKMNLPDFLHVAASTVDNGGK